MRDLLFLSAAAIQIPQRPAIRLHFTTGAKEPNRSRISFQRHQERHQDHIDQGRQTQHQKNEDGIYEFRDRRIRTYGKDKTAEKESVHFRSTNYYHLLMTLTSVFAAPQDEISAGEDALYSETIDGILLAHSIFSNAQSAYPQDPVINGYLALTQLLLFGIQQQKIEYGCHIANPGPIQSQRVI